MKDDGLNGLNSSNGSSCLRVQKGSRVEGLKADSCLLVV